ncbi:MAG: amidohydrolase family protein [Planctomycetota bacterium]
MFTRFALAAAAVTLLFAGAAHAAPPPEKIALTGATVITAAGDDIENATILVENGTITAVGGDVEIPFDAFEYDVEGKFIMPGMIDPHSSAGMSVQNEPLPVAPFVSVRDAIDPVQLYFEDCLRRGITTVHVSPGNNTVIGGTSMVVSPIGRSVSDMTIIEHAAMKFSATPRAGYDRMRQLAEIREAFFTLEQTTKALAEEKYEESKRDDGEPLDVLPDEAAERGMELLEDEDFDLGDQRLRQVARGELQTWMAALTAGDVRSALAMADDLGVTEHTTVVVDASAHKNAEALKEAGVGVVFDGELRERVRDPFTGDLSDTFAPKVLHDAGIPFAITPEPDATLAEGYPNYQAALLIRYGVPRADAIKAVTQNAADIIGVGEEVGSIETGKSGNLVVFSGDPLDFASHVEMVFIEGILAYDRQKDIRLERLLNLEAASANDEDMSAETAEDAADTASDDGSADAPSASTDGDNAGDTGGDSE